MPHGASSRGAARLVGGPLAHIAGGLIQGRKEAPAGIENPSLVGMFSAHGEPPPSARARQQGHINSARNAGNAEPPPVNCDLAVHQWSLSRLRNGAAAC